ncbi:MAG: PLP-dependent aminotransferase family protein [Bauldia sp.]|uniref:rhizopine catabolism transcriptional regulator MocR n=1 Tax=Bauldia sp. TaxID=2575872 RepID=UPI001D1FD969|nr:PLP-dependent aminotransferase family protein [Bauldia sp.]MCB1494601.1 PLP-dependent aminotransferase family protein [Bauldia sp.]
MGTVSNQLSYPLDLVALRPKNGAPLHRQLCDQLRELILEGAVPAGTRLPSIRAFAGELAISRNTVIAALDQLAAEGLLESRRGSGTHVSAAVPVAQPSGPAPAGARAELSRRGELMTAQPRVRTFPGRTAFHPGTPELAEFPFKTWSRLLSRRARFGGEDLFGYHYISGHPELRDVIASFLSAMRRVRCSPEQIVVTTGGQAALDLLARLLLAEGDTVWMEEPGYLGARAAFLGAGARLSPLTVDRDGWRVPADPKSPPRLIYLTPSCQHPLGITMPLEQRLAVLEVARAANSWVIEDDFDGEYTFRGQPLPSMQGLTDNPRVIYVGTFSKTLFPAIRLGFIVLPPDLADRIKPAISNTGQFAPLVLQAALADFIEQGYFFRHLNRMRRLYGRRRAVFLTLLDDHLGPWLAPIDGRTGIQLAAPFRAPIDDHAVVDRAAAAGINLAPLSVYFAGKPSMSGLLMGYAGVAEGEMRLLVPRLKRIFEDIDPRMVDEAIS